MKKIVLAIGLFSFLLSGCLKNSEFQQSCTYDPCAYKAPNSEIQAVQAYLDSSSITAVQHCSGLFYKIDNPGTGAAPTACSNIVARYKGMLTNGTVFEEPANPVPVYLSRVILGWANGVPLIKQGGRITLYIPPSLGYGSQVNGPIPANSILIFEVELVTVG